MCVAFFTHVRYTVLTASTEGGGTNWKKWVLLPFARMGVFLRD